jgi:hypothetical protein
MTTEDADLRWELKGMVIRWISDENAQMHPAIARRFPSLLTRAVSLGQDWIGPGHVINLPPYTYV